MMMEAMNGLSDGRLKFAGRRTRIFLYCSSIMFVTKFFSLSVDPSLILHFSLLGNCASRIVWIRPCGTDSARSCCTAI